MLVKDAEVAPASATHLAGACQWSQSPARCGPARILGAQALESQLDTVGQPFLDRAGCDLRQRNVTLVLDADLDRPAGEAPTSQTFPGAAFGYMDGEVRLGYQSAQTCLRTALFGRQWLSAQHHPGDTVSAPCLLDLLQAAERRLGCHPRRRTEPIRQRMEACEQVIRAALAQTTSANERVTVVTARLTRLTEQIQQAEGRIQALRGQPASARQAGPYSQLNRLLKQQAGWQGHNSAVPRRNWRRPRRSWNVSVHGCSRKPRRTRRNANSCKPATSGSVRKTPSNPMRHAAKSGWMRASPPARNLTELIELGYDIDTKAANPAVVRALWDRVTAATHWTTVGKNAAMVSWPGYQIHDCPYPLLVGLDAFIRPKVGCMRCLSATWTTISARVDLTQWFHDYNGRQTIEAGNKEEKQPPSKSNT